MHIQHFLLGQLKTIQKEVRSQSKGCITEGEVYHGQQYEWMNERNIEIITCTLKLLFFGKDKWKQK